LRFLMLSCEGTMVCDGGGGESSLQYGGAGNNKPVGKKSVKKTFKKRDKTGGDGVRVKPVALIVLGIGGCREASDEWQ